MRTSKGHKHTHVYTQTRSFDIKRLSLWCDANHKGGVVGGQWEKGSAALEAANFFFLVPNVPFNI